MRIKDQLKELNVKPTKERGQNFLYDSGAIQELIRFGTPKKDDQLVEIGPGLGALTKELVNFGNLTVIEIESNFCSKLKAQFPNIEIVNADVRTVDFSEIGEDLVIFGNLPYSLSTEIIFHLLSFEKVISRAVFMLQKEFVERMVAKPGGKDYGALSIACQLGAAMRTGPIFSGDMFHPPTKVDSQAIELRVFKEPPFGVTPEERSFLQLVVRAAFFKRRKKLINSIKASTFFNPLVVDQALTTAGIDPNRRAETLTVEEFVTLSRALRATDLKS